MASGGSRRRTDLDGWPWRAADLSGAATPSSCARRPWRSRLPSLPPSLPASAMAGARLPLLLGVRRRMCGPRSTCRMVRTSVPDTGWEPILVHTACPPVPRYSKFCWKPVLECCFQYPGAHSLNSWPSSDRVPLMAPGYVKMPGRPKTERRREPTEARKATKMPKTGTIIRCSKCRLTGHNRSTCPNISGVGPSQATRSQKAAGSHPTGSQSAVGSHPTGSQSAAGGNSNAILLLSNTQKSTTSGTKRNSMSDASSAQSKKKAKATNSQNLIKSSARARVSTIPSGSATINLQARVPTANVNCSVNVQLTGGTASAHVSAQEPAKPKRTPKRYGVAPLQMLPPWQSDKL